MTRGQRSRLASVCTLAALLVVTTALAGSAQTFGELPRRVSPGTEVSVTDTEGQRFRGKVDAVTADRLDLLLRDTQRRWSVPRTWAPSSVREVRRTERSWDKALLGAALASAVVGLLMAADLELDIDAGERGKNLLLAGSVGAGIGFGLDALFPPRLVYRTPRIGRSDTRPGANGQAAAVGFALRF